MSKLANEKIAPDVAPQPPPQRTGSLADRVRSLRLPELAATPAPPRRRWIPWGLCLALSGLSGYLALRPAAPPSVLASDSREPLTSEEGPASPTGRVALEAGGYIIPVHRVQVSPKVGGEVVDLRIEEGQYVAKGTRLAKIDETKYRFEYRRTVALADQARADYEKMKTGNREEEKRQAAAALREAEELRDQVKDQARRLHRAASAASAEELFRTESQLSGAEHKVEQLRQAERLMREGFRKEDIEKAWQTYLLAVAQRDNAKYDLENTQVVAPVSGVILAKHAEIGNAVRPEAFSNGLSASLCDMADLRELEVDVDVSERDLIRVFKGQKCEIRTEAYPETVHPGYVSRLMPEADKSKASVSVRVRIDPVPADAAVLRPQMRARVGFLAMKTAPEINK